MHKKRIRKDILLISFLLHSLGSLSYNKRLLSGRRIMVNQNNVYDRMDSLQRVKVFVLFF